MNNADDQLGLFAFDSALGWWEAELPVPLWGGQLPIMIDATAAGPSARQVATLRAVLARAESLRGPIGEALLAHYRDDWGCVTPSLGPAPALHSADEVWPAMSGFGIYIPAFRSEGGRGSRSVRAHPGLGGRSRCRANGLPRGRRLARGW
jgi:hypothetical protein